MQHTRQHFLARASRAHQECADLGLRDLLRQRQQLLAGRIHEHHTARPRGRRRRAQLGTDDLPSRLGPVLGRDHLIGAQSGGLRGQVYPMRRHSAHHRQAPTRHLRQGQALLEHVYVVLHPHDQHLHVHERRDQLARIQQVACIKAQAGHACLLGGISGSCGVDPGNSDGGCTGAHGGVGLTVDTNRQATAMPTRQTIAEERQVLVYKGNPPAAPPCRFFDDSTLMRVPLRAGLPAGKSAGTL